MSLLLLPLPLPTSLSLPLLLLLLTSLLAAIPVLQATNNSPSAPSTSPSAGPGVRILRAPESRVAPPGDEVVFVCVTSLPPERFEWSYAATSSSSRPRFRYLKPSSAKSNYNITITHDNDMSKLSVYVRTDTIGEYRCVAWFGALAVSSTTARLELASISSEAVDKHQHWRVAAGNTVLWHCGHVESNPAPSWSYYRNGIELPAASTLSDSNGTLLLSPVSTSSSGTYSCAATNTASGVRLSLPSRLELHVIAAVEAAASPQLSKGQYVRTEVLARAGETVLLLCPGVGSPPPTAVWSSPDVPGAISNNSRTRVLPYGLQISDLLPTDAGTYICYLDNGIRPTMEHLIKLLVQQAPRIVHPPSANLTNEGERMQLDCVATGVPQPEIYWLLNGESSIFDTEAEQLSNGTLILHSVQKRHASFVQCFARNSLGEHSAGTLLQVNPTQIQTGEGTGGGERGGGGGGKSSNRGGHNRKQKQMVPPSAPNVTRLSDESVMLRWHVAPNDGLPIQFFKVQYRTLTENGKRRSWQTTNENIPYGKQQRQVVKNFTSSVTGLRPDRSYRFRIMAVYSNNDNKESNTSGKFFLQRGAKLAPLAVPELERIEEYSQTAVVLHWRLASEADEQLISGYYAYYRPSASAGEYLKATIDGARSRSFQISALEPGTFYEFKLQSFSAVAASEFSALKQGRTQKPKVTTTPQPVVHSMDTTTPGHNETFNMSPLLTGTIGGGALLVLLVVSACLCLCRRRSSRGGGQQQNKPRLAELREDFVPLSACSPNKPRTRHIHITLNPLAQQQQQQQQQLPQQQQHEEKDVQDNDLGYFQRQPTDALGYTGLTRMSSSSLRRSSGGGGGANNNNLNQSADGSLSTSADSPRLQSSQSKPGRVILKQRARLSSRSENLSSGSLNSVGV